MSVKETTHICCLVSQSISRIPAPLHSRSSPSLAATSAHCPPAVELSCPSCFPTCSPFSLPQLRSQQDIRGSTDRLPHMPLPGCLPSEGSWKAVPFLDPPCSRPTLLSLPPPASQPLALHWSFQQAHLFQCQGLCTAAVFSREHPSLSFSALHPRRSRPLQQNPVYLLRSSHSPEIT